jgi:integrase
MVRGCEFPDQTKPLTSNERDRVIEAAKNSRAAAKVTTFLILFSGLRAMAAPHVTSDLVSVMDGNKLKITLPPGEHQCQIIGPYRKKTKGLGLGGNRSCHLCEGGTYEFESPRSIPVFEEMAVNTISDWFEIYDYMPSHGAMLKLLAGVGEKAGVERLKPSVLRHSFGVLLAGKGFDRKEIESIMGMNPIKPDSEAVLAYGRICEGEYPFVCGAETENTDGRCEMPVIEGRCYYHSE